MNLAPSIRILIVAAICVAGLIGLVVRESMARDGGTEVIMPMEAVDPRALLQGHYVVVSLAERLEAGEACPPGLADQAQFFPWNDEPLPQTWVALAPRGAHHRPIGVFAEKDQAGALAVRGRAHCTDVPALADAAARGSIITDLGINRFYASQAEAQRIERLLRGQDDATQIAAIISIGRDGRGRLNGLLVDGERLELGWN